jgi:hypothetical protein
MICAGIFAELKNMRRTPFALAIKNLYHTEFCVDHNAAISIFRIWVNANAKNSLSATNSPDKCSCLDLGNETEI